MLSQIEIRNFQSLHHVKLELSRFTVIVGASSSGKSAFTRAVRLLTSNARGNSFITHNERVTTIKAVTDSGTIILTRGRTTADDGYTVVPNDPSLEQVKYTKLGGSVPEEVSAFIGIPAKDPINYASQHDKPYLLDNSAPEVARVLGQLTNVNVIFEGARESNRQKLASSSTLKTRSADMESILLKAQTYRSLKEQRAALERAEDGLVEATRINGRITRLKALVEQVEVAENAVQRLTPLAQITIPDVKRIEQAAQRSQLFKSILRDIGKDQQAARAAQAEVEAQETRIQQLEAQYVEMLINAGTCPTCSQSTKDLEHAH